MSTSPDDRSTDSPRPGDRLRRVSVSEGDRESTRILDVAAERGVTLQDDADLAAVLRRIGLDREIPQTAFVAVAELLTALYRANAAAETESGPAEQEDR